MAEKFLAYFFCYGLGIRFRACWMAPTREPPIGLMTDVVRIEVAKNLLGQSFPPAVLD